MSTFVVDFSFKSWMKETSVKRQIKH